MKKQAFLLAVFAMAVMTFTVVSCQKDNNTTYQNPNTSKQAYQPPQVDDMLTYLKDFKQKIQTRGIDGTLALDEAAWHLSSLANYDFGDVRREFSDFHYDTLYSHIDVDNGSVSMADMAATYNSIAGMVESFYQNIDLPNPAPRFIDVAIDGNGLVTVALMTSYRNRDWSDYSYYFPSVYDRDSVLENLGIDIDLNLSLWNEFPDELKRVLNIQTAYTSAYGQSNSGSDRVFYTMTRVDTLAYDAYIDPLGSPYPNGYMIMHFLNHPSYVDYDEFAYCFDRYAYIAMGSLQTAIDEVVIKWIELPLKHYYDPLGYTYQCPKIKYGIPTVVNNNNPQN